MELKKLSQYVISPLFAAAVLLTAGPALAQRQAFPPVEVPAPIARPQACPEPINLTLNANTPDLFSGDFTAGQFTDQVGLNDPRPNKHYLHTFQWTPRHRCCCQITKAVLTVHMRANQSGQSYGSPDAGNDGIDVMYNGNTVAPYVGHVYPQSVFPFQVGQQATTQWDLQGAALSNINSSNRLSFYVEDDTEVTSATLQLSGCCLNIECK